MQRDTTELQGTFKSEHVQEGNCVCCVHSAGPRDAAWTAEGRLSRHAQGTATAPHVPEGTLVTQLRACRALCAHNTIHLLLVGGFQIQKAGLSSGHGNRIAVADPCSRSALWHSARRRWILSLLPDGTHSSTDHTQEAARRVPSLPIHAVADPLAS